jgi:hypothetical protein
MPRLGPWPNSSPSDSGQPPLDLRFLVACREVACVARLVNTTKHGCDGDLSRIAWPKPRQLSATSFPLSTASFQTAVTSGHKASKCSGSTIGFTRAILLHQTSRGLESCRTNGLGAPPCILISTQSSRRSRTRPSREFDAYWRARAKHVKCPGGDIMRTMNSRASAFAVGRGLTVALFVAVLTFGEGHVGGASTSPKAGLVRASCATRVVDGILPFWARAGFSERAPKMPYELGANGDIAAILWADPLLSPPPKTHNNKILWVSRLSVNGSALLISAQLTNGPRPIGRAIQREVTGGPGPSIINLPTAGCWRVALHWSGHSDALYLNYSHNTAA